MNRRRPPLMWRLVGLGAYCHTPAGVDYGPKQACPYEIEVADGMIRLTKEADGRPLLNPGAARWLGLRLIEAAALAETVSLDVGLLGADNEEAGQ